MPRLCLDLLPVFESSFPSVRIRPADRAKVVASSVGLAPNKADGRGPAVAGAAVKQTTETHHRGPLVFRAPLRARQTLDVITQSEPFERPANSCPFKQPSVLAVLAELAVAPAIKRSSALFPSVHGH